MKRNQLLDLAINYQTGLSYHEVQLNKVSVSYFGAEIFKVFCGDTNDEYSLAGHWSKSFKSLGGINGDGLKKLPNAVYCDVLNTMFKYSGNKTAQLCVYNDMVYAGLSKDYKSLSVVELLKTLISKLKISFPNYSIVYAEFNPEYSIVDFRLNNKNLDIMYSNALNVPTDEISFLLRFQTSDAGWCCSTLIPMIEENGRKLYVSEPLTIKHIGTEATIDNFAENCNRIYTLAEEGANNLQEMRNIEINYPVSCFCNLCEKLHIGETIINTSQLCPTLTKILQSGEKANALKLYRWVGVVTCGKEKEGVSNKVAETLIAEKQKAVLFFTASAWKKLDRETCKYRLEQKL